MSGSIDPTKRRKKTLGIAGLGPGQISQKLSNLSVTSRPLGQIPCANTDQTGTTRFFFLLELASILSGLIFRPLTDQCDPF